MAALTTLAADNPILRYEEDDDEEEDDVEDDEDEYEDEDGEPAEEEENGVPGECEISRLQDEPRRRVRIRHSAIANIW